MPSTALSGPPSYAAPPRTTLCPFSQGVTTVWRVQPGRVAGKLFPAAATCGCSNPGFVRRLAARVDSTPAAAKVSPASRRLAGYGVLFIEGVYREVGKQVRARGNVRAFGWKVCVELPFP